MASPLSRKSAGQSLVSALREAVHRGEWNRSPALVAALARETPPEDPAALGEYLTELREALISARAARAHLVFRLNRIRAAAGFLRGTEMNGINASLTRHDFVDSPDS